MTCGASWCGQDPQGLQAATAQRFSFGGIRGTVHVDVQGKGRDLVTAPHPAHPPADARSRAVLPPRFGMEAPSRAGIDLSDLRHLLLGRAREGQPLVGQAGEKAGLLDGADGQGAA